jgi:multicomponent Na+:H+ antiporter subunit D
MTSLLLHPVLPFALAALLVPWVGVPVRRVLSLAAPALALASLAALPDGATYALNALGHDWVLLRADGLATVFATAFILYALMAGVYAWHDTGRGPKAMSLVLAGAGTGVVLAGDLLTLFFFWEWLTVASLFMIWFGNTQRSWDAGFRYLIFHLAGAIVMLTGTLMLLADGITTFEVLPTGTTASYLVLAGMVTNAAVPPLHAWLSDAYPEASIFGTVFLSAFTTKSAVYALVRGFPGLELLMWAGIVMAFFGVFYAVMENNIRRLLSYHIISQVGYMVTGIGLGTALSLNGTSAHAFSHIFYKGLLMMSAGAVIHATGRGRLSDLGRLAKPLKWTLVLMMIGALSISGAPLFSGFVSKSMIVSAAAYAEQAPVELVLIIVSMGTFLSVALKMPWFTFAGEDRGATVIRPVHTSMYIGMVLTALVCFVTGVIPGATLYRLLPFDAVYEPFTGHHFVEVLQLMAGTALGFWFLRVRLTGKAKTTLDTDYLYRRPLAWAILGAGDALGAVGARVKAVNGRAIQAGWRGLQAYGSGRTPSTLGYQATVVVLAIAIISLVVIAFQG